MSPFHLSTPFTALADVGVGVAIGVGAGVGVGDAPGVVAEPLIPWQPASNKHIAAQSNKNELCKTARVPQPGPIKVRPSVKIKSHSVRELLFSSCGDHRELHQ